MLSQKAKYAFRALLVLAANADDAAPTSILDIAEREQLSRKFLEAILVELRDAGIVTSERGRRGGYRLARPATAIRFSDVIRAIDGPLAPTLCASRTKYAPCEDCLDVETCAIRWAMIRARDAIAAALDDCTLADALRKQKAAIARRAPRRRRGAKT
jgi:Rrf2 family protein